MSIITRNKYIIFIILLFPFFSFGQINNPTIKLEDLEGTWFINYSNFPMWLNGNKTSPTFNYTLIKKENAFYLYDEVRFIKKDKAKSIVGVDKPLNKNNSFFEWRGSGLLKVLKSKWRILHFDSKNNWAIIYFEKTLFTPEGYDVISRNKKLPIEITSLMKQKLLALNIEVELSEIKHHSSSLN